MSVLGYLYAIECLHETILISAHIVHGHEGPNWPVLFFHTFVIQNFLFYLLGILSHNKLAESTLT